VRVIAITDVHYSDATARAACALAARWTDEHAVDEHVVEVAVTEAYQPGAFYLRELPPLVRVLEPFVNARRVDVVVVDAYVWLGEGRPGLGARLFEALGGTIAVVGVAKTAFRDAPGTAVLRGASTRALYVTAAGMAEQEAADAVRSMHGEHRIPTLIRRADALGRRDGGR
jgi:deoxyribonuclease V